VSENGDLLVGEGPFDTVRVVAEPIIILLVVFVIRRIVCVVFCWRMLGSEEVGVEMICREPGKVCFVECSNLSL
jgi:hypothetical protein